MARNNAIINSFITGEASPKFRGRTDTSQYAQSCEDITNWQVFPQGGSGRRPGTQYMDQILVNNGNYPAQARIFPFSAADGSRWQIVMTDLIPDVQDSGNSRYTWYAYNIDTFAIFRIVYHTGGIVPATYYNFKTLSLGSFPFVLADIQYAQTGDVMFFVHPYMRPFVITYDPVHSSFTMSPFPDIMTSIFNLQNYQMCPMQTPVAATTNTLTLTGTTTPTFGSTYTITPGSGSGITFTAAWIGRTIRFSSGTNTISVIVTAFTSSTSITATFNGGAFASSPATFGGFSGSISDGTDYEISYWDNLNGWPRTVAFFEGRLVFGGNIVFPDTAWYSEVENINNFETRKFEQDPTFAVATANTDPFDLTLNSEVLNQYRWMSPGQTITAGTNCREFVVEGPDQSNTIGPLNFGSTAETSQGSAYVQAVRVENTTVFLERDRRKLRELVYTVLEQSFQANDLSIIGEHIANKSALKFLDPVYTNREGYFVQLAYQSVPNGIVWCIDNNGSLIGMTRQRQQQVMAWHYHELGGASVDGNGASFHPQITSINTIQSPELSADRREPDELWMLVKRSVQVSVGTWKFIFFMERMAKEWTNASFQDGWDDFTALTGSSKAPIYMDCTMLIGDADPSDPGSLTNTGLVHNLVHGIGQTVSCILNGIYLGDFVVSSTGTIDLSTAASGFLGSSGPQSPWQLMVGFNFIADLIPAVQELPAPTGTSMGQPRRIHQLVVHFNRAMACKFGSPPNPNQEDTPFYPLEDIDFGDQSNPSVGIVPIKLYTGDKKCVFANGFDDRQKLLLRSDKPFPCEITHIVMKGVVYE